MRIRSRLSLLTLILSLLSGCMHAPLVSSNPDPYRWLESPVADPRVTAWLQQQAQKTHDWQQRQPAYQQFRDQLLAAWDHPKWRVAAIQRDQVFFYFNAGLDDHYSLYQQPYPSFIADRARGRSPVGSARLLLDDEVFTADTSPGIITISPDARWLAYQINRVAPSGHQHSLWYLQSLTDRSAQPALLSVDHEGWTLPAERLVWGHAGEKLYFTVSAPPGPEQMSGQNTPDGAGWQSRLYALRINGSASDPELIHMTRDSRHIEQLHASANGLLMGVADEPAAGNVNVLRWAVIDPMAAAADELAGPGWLSRMPAGHAARHTGQYVGDIAGVPAFLIHGARGTGAIMLADPQGWRTLIPESQAPLHAALVVGQKLVLEYLVHGSSTLQVVHLDGRPADDIVALPSPVRIETLRATTEHQLLISYSGILTPPRSVLFDLHSGQQVTLTNDRPDVSLTGLRASLVRVDAADGTRVPVWITDSGRSRGHDQALMLLEVYGGFAAPMETSFSISRLVWLARGGALAVAGPRGGGDYGTRWHEAGSGERRYNSSADVLAVAEWLRSEHLGENGRLAISGRSHGGLLATEVVHQAPDLFAALVADAAVFDLMRLDALGGARSWQQEYRGAISSPYQALLAGGRDPVGHPPALLVTRTNDAVVAPAHSFKYLQALQVKSLPGYGDALLSVTPGRGHDVSGRVTDLIDDYALRWTFLSSQLITPPASD